MTDSPPEKIFKSNHTKSAQGTHEQGSGTHEGAFKYKNITFRHTRVA
jgi:hypothetical protein